MLNQPILAAAIAALVPFPLLAEPVLSRDKSRGDIFFERNPEAGRKAIENASRKEITTLAQAWFRAGKTGGFAKLKARSAPLLNVETEDDNPAVNTKPLPPTLRTFEDFVASLKTSVIVEKANGEPVLGGIANAGNDKVVEVTYYHVEEDVALEYRETILFYDHTTEVFQGRNDAFEDTFVSADPAGSSVVQTPLRAATEAGKIVRWTPGSTLSYCVLRWTFGEDQEKYDQVCKNVASAAADWSAVCNIKFEHRKEFDGVDRNVTFPVGPDGKRAVLFVIAQQEIGDTIARAFFPNDPRHRRLLLVDPEEYYTTKINKVGILRHELGHVLGCRHEHISPDAPAWVSDFCQKETANGSKPITKFDRASVMHYPCVTLLEKSPLDENLELKITELDKTGIQAVYGAPGTAAPSGDGFKSFDPAP